MKLSSEMIEEAANSSAPPNFAPSPHQEAIRDWVLNGKGSANVIAVAGSGKTTTLVWIAQWLSGSAVFTAFNKKIADEIGRRLSESGRSTVQAKTLHAIGFAAWKKANPGVKVEADKLRDLCDEEDIPYKQIGSVSKLVSIARNAGYLLNAGATRPDESWWISLIDHFDLMGDYDTEASEDVAMERLIQQAEHILNLSAKRGTETIDFDEMIYLPLRYGATFWKNDWVLLDEAQDTNLTRRLLVSRMLKPGGRLIAVGDPRQAIYGFTGADADAMDLIKRDRGSIELPLTITFRCPKAITRHAQRWVSHITAAETATEGVVREMNEWDWRKTEQTREKLNADSVVLCRYTKPLVSLAFTCIRKNIPCHVEGKEIGKGLITLIRKMRATSLDELHTSLSEYQSKMTAKWRERRQEQKIEQLSDKIETIFVIMESVEEAERPTDSLAGKPSIQMLISAIEGLFGDTPDGGKSRDLTLSTIHKAKGREWDRVILWGRNAFMPSKYAKQEWQLLQEDNLIYVAVTRAKKELIEVVVNA